MVVRTIEFFVVLGSGTFANMVLVSGSGDMESYPRIVFVAAVAFAVLAETVGSYDIEAQFSLRQAWQRVATAWITTSLFMVTLGFPA